MNKLGLGLSAAVVVVGLVLTGVGIAHAGNLGPGRLEGPGDGSHGGRHGLAGEITAINTGTDKLTITTKKGDVFADLSYADAKCKIPKPLGGAGGQPVACTTVEGNIKVGDFAAVSLKDGDEIRRLNLVAGPSLHGHCVGTVVGNVAGIGDPVNDMTVLCKAKNGTTVSRNFNLTADTKFSPKGTVATDIDNGETVTVVYRRDRTDGSLDPRHVVLHKGG